MGSRLDRIFLIAIILGVLCWFIPDTTNFVTLFKLIAYLTPFRDAFFARSDAPLFFGFSYLLYLSFALISGFYAALRWPRDGIFVLDLSVKSAARFISLALCWFVCFWLFLPAIVLVKATWVSNRFFYLFMLNASSFLLMYVCFFACVLFRRFILNR